MHSFIHSFVRSFIHSIISSFILVERSEKYTKRQFRPFKKSRVKAIVQRTARNMKQLQRANPVNNSTDGVTDKKQAR